MWAASMFGSTEFRHYTLGCMEVADGSCLWPLRLTSYGHDWMQVSRGRNGSFLPFYDLLWDTR